jgi:spore germination protein KA
MVGCEMPEFTTIEPEAIAEQIAMRLHQPPDLVNQRFALAPDLYGQCVFLESIVDKEKIENAVACMIADYKYDYESPLNGEELISRLTSSLPVIPVRTATDVETCVQAILEGHCMLLVLRTDSALMLDVAKATRREIAEPKTETTVRGPHEGLTEDYKLNVALIRKRLKNPNLILEPFVLGANTRTNVVIAYVGDLAPDDLVATFRARIQAIQTDSVMDSSYVEEWIQDKIVTPFPTLLSTERPDVVTAHLLEGRVAVLVDGSPFALIGPITFFQFFTAPEDYYQRADIATLLRWLRALAFLMAIFVPSVFIAIVLYHHELLPNPLLINIAAQREGVPFPAFLEAILMLMTFEVLREAGLRMPRIAGQAISIVGALVLGEAAVQAGLVTAAMVIVVAVTAISNFVSPSYSFGIAQRLLQFGYIALAGFMGLYGIMCGVLFTVVHLVSLKSFGVPYLAPIAPTFISDWKDILVRVPRPWMTTFPRMNHVKKKRR